MVFFPLFYFTKNQKGHVTFLKQAHNLHCPGDGVIPWDPAVWQAPIQSTLWAPSHHHSQQLHAGSSPLGLCRSASIITPKFGLPPGCQVPLGNIARLAGAPPGKSPTGLQGPAAGQPPCPHHNSLEGKDRRSHGHSQHQCCDQAHSRCPESETETGQREQAARLGDRPIHEVAFQGLALPETQAEGA